MKGKDYAGLIKAQNDLIKSLDDEAKEIAKKLHANREARRKAIEDRQAIALEKKTANDAVRIAKAEQVAEKKAERAKRAQAAALKLQESVKAEKAKIEDIKSTSGKIAAKRAHKKTPAPQPAIELDPLALEKELESLK